MRESAIYMCENRIMKPITIVLKIQGEIWKRNRGGKFDQRLLQTYMEISQWNPFEQNQYH
jgi:hypothetical protein